jgi:hypothetical protein
VIPQFKNPLGNLYPWGFFIDKMNLIDIAEELIIEGYSVLPLNDDKSPKLPSGHKLLYNIMPIDDVPKLFHSAPKIGIACGKVSNGFYCLDFDAHNDEPIENIFNQFIDMDFVKGLLNDGKLSCYKTAGGGYHVYFLSDVDTGGEAIAYWETKSVMIEIRGKGQYACCYPSKGYKHIGGVEYVKLSRLDDDQDFTNIKDICHSFNMYKDVVFKQKNAPSDGKWAETWKLTTPDGKYNLECQNEAKELLKQMGWQLSKVSVNDVEYWTRPNKDPKDGFSATFGHYNGMFYVFSEDQNTIPFQSKQAYSPFNILTLVKYDGDWKRAKDTLRERFNMVDNDTFWTTNEKGGYVLNNKRFKDFLEINDFFKNIPNESSTFNFIRKEGIFYNIVYETDIKDFVIQWIENNKCQEGVFNLISGNLKFFKREFLSMVKTQDIKTLKDTKDSCYLFYKNCIVKVTEKGNEILSYGDIDVGVWKDQVINRDYHPTDHHQSEYRKFIWLISGQDVNKYNSFKTVIGYLLHSYKNNSNNKAIIFNDEVISDNPNGRSGKGLFWNALKKIKKVQSLDGKTFDFNKSFPYQSVSTDCQILVFDDVKKNFNFENLFSVITEGISIEYKGKDSIKLDVTESPKIIITTNYTIKGDSASFNARKYEVEMSQYFSDKYTPMMEFGHELFNDWDQDEWARFDNYMIQCIQIYLKNGLIDMPTINLEFRKVMDDIGKEMYQFFETLQMNKDYNVKETYMRLLDNYPELKKRNNVTQILMTTRLKKYCNFKDYKFKLNYSGGIGIFEIIKLENPFENEVSDELF